MSFAKLHESILESTVWLEDSDVRIVWITMLAMKDRDGVVLASVPGLAKRAGVPRESCERALRSFLSPDPDSRTKDYDGRRIVAADGGWRLLNNDKYRDLLSTNDIRARDADRKRRWREKQRSSSVGHVPESHAGHDGHAPSPEIPQAEEESISDPNLYVDGKGEADTPTPPISKGVEQGKAKADLRKILASMGLPASPSDVDEWKGGLQSVARVSSVAEADEFMRWAVELCRSQGVAEIHWRHVSRLAAEWDQGQRQNPGR